MTLVSELNDIFTAFDRISEQFGCERLLLHSRALGFRHPVSGEWIERTAPLDPVFSRVAGRFVKAD